MTNKEQEIHQIVEKQRSWFLTGATLNLNSRIEALNRLKTCILQQKANIHEALSKDLGKSSFES